MSRARLKTTPDTTREHKVSNVRPRGVHCIKRCRLNIAGRLKWLSFLVGFKTASAISNNINDRDRLLPSVAGRHRLYRPLIAASGTRATASRKIPVFRAGPQLSRPQETEQLPRSGHICQVYHEPRPERERRVAFPARLRERWKKYPQIPTLT